MTAEEAEEEKTVLHQLNAENSTQRIYHWYDLKDRSDMRSLKSLFKNCYQTYGIIIHGIMGLYPSNVFGWKATSKPIKLFSFGIFKSKTMGLCLY